MSGVIRGMDDLREWLEARGCRCAEDGLRDRDNGATWYAYRASALPARECECNTGKSMQLVIKPSSLTLDGHTYESVSVSVTGEVRDTWCRLEAYSLRPAELRERLDDIERSLIAAWNALA